MPGHMHLCQLRSPRGGRLDGFYFCLSFRRVYFWAQKSQEKLDTQIPACLVVESRQHNPESHGVPFQSRKSTPLTNRRSWLWIRTTVQSNQFQVKQKTSLLYACLDCACWRASRLGEAAESTPGRKTHWYKKQSEALTNCKETCERFYAQAFFPSDASCFRQVVQHVRLHVAERSKLINWRKDVRLLIEWPQK